ncbi:MAG: hypothetical protein O3A46_16960, partial [Candidatus Poribacteria bacterium]|nr:hypothetical protein [Candidatus Poribacteria bacterium]
MKTPSSNPVTWRAILLGLLLSVPHIYFSVQTPTPTTVSLVYPVLLTLLALAAGNLALKRWLPRVAFTQAELITLYTTLSIAVAFSGSDILQILMPVIAHAYRFASPENEWDTLFFRFLPDWLIVKDPAVLIGLYEGESTLYTLAKIKAWATPALWWSVLLIALTFVMLGLNVLIRRQWIHHERLSYPITQLPYALAEEGGSRAFFASPLLWVGIGVSGGIDLINGLHAFFPMIPLLPVRSIEIGSLFRDAPWDAIGWTPLCFYPFAIGLAFLMPLDLSMSCWVFYWVWKMQYVMGDALGLRGLPEFPYIKQQASGAYLGIAVIALYKGRHHLRNVARRLARPVGTAEERTERRQYRAGVGMIGGGGAVIVAFCLKAGMSLWVIGVFFAFYFLLTISLTRLRAELGPPVHELYNMGPDKMLPKVLGTRMIGQQNLSMFALFWGFNRAHRSNPMPVQLEGLKMADAAG